MTPGGSLHTPSRAPGPEAEGAPAVSVVLPVRNGAATLARQLSALAGQDAELPWELVVVDNGSVDASRSVAERWAERLPALRVVVEPRRGVNRARNRGVRAARAPRIVLCDADDEVDPSWLRCMTAGLDRFDLVGGALEVDRLNGPSPMRAECVQRDALPKALGHRYAVGANLGFGRHVFDALDGFDEAFVIGCDEVEFCLRAQLAGFSLGFLPEAVVHYRVRHGLGPVIRQRLQYGSGYQRLVDKAVRLEVTTSPPRDRWRAIGHRARNLAGRWREVRDPDRRVRFAAAAAALAGEAGWLARDGVRRAGSPARG